MGISRGVLILLLVAAALSIAAVFWLGGHSRPPALAEFAFHDGRPWTRISIAGREEMALADTGTALPILNPRLVPESNSGAISQRTVRSPFGRYQLRAATVKSMRVLSRDFARAEVLVEGGGPSTVGASILFQPQNTLIAMDGIYFDIDPSRHLSMHCVRIVLDLLGPNLDSPVGRLYFLLDIDGVEQKVLFDTGRSDVLVGTASAPGAASRWPRFEVHRDLNGRLRVWRYYQETGTIRLGTQTLAVTYKRFPALDSIDASYVLGAGLLATHSVLIEHRRGRACFVPR